MLSTEIICANKVINLLRHEGVVNQARMRLLHFDMILHTVQSCLFYGNGTVRHGVVITDQQWASANRHRSCDTAEFLREIPGVIMFVLIRGVAIA